MIINSDIMLTSPTRGCADGAGQVPGSSATLDLRVEASPPGDIDGTQHNKERTDNAINEP